MSHRGINNLRRFFGGRAKIGGGGGGWYYPSGMKEIFDTRSIAVFFLGGGQTHWREYPHRARTASARRQVFEQLP